jgi:hypothetical protein
MRFLSMRAVVAEPVRNSKRETAAPKVYDAAAGVKLTGGMLSSVVGLRSSGIARKNGP